MLPTEPDRISAPRLLAQQYFKLKQENEPSPVSTPPSSGGFLVYAACIWFRSLSKQAPGQGQNASTRLYKGLQSQGTVWLERVDSLGSQISQQKGDLPAQARGPMPGFL